MESTDVNGNNNNNIDLHNIKNFKNDILCETKIKSKIVTTIQFVKAINKKICSLNKV